MSVGTYTIVCGIPWAATLYHAVTICSDYKRTTELVGCSTDNYDGSPDNNHHHESAYNNRGATSLTLLRDGSLILE